MSLLSWTVSIAIGAVGGAWVRHLAYLYIERRNQTVFPIPSLFVNLVGSFLIGLFAALGTSGAIDRFGTELLVAGGCGSLTTFSIFSSDWMRLNRGGHKGLGILYVSLTLLFGLGLAALGLALGHQIP
ncbi:MAG: CrcB family protein [Myxococcota bacterium]|nr:CrcB family protein [Myxococcota bacterium]